MERLIANMHRGRWWPVRRHTRRRTGGTLDEGSSATAIAAAAAASNSPADGPAGQPAVALRPGPVPTPASGETILVISDDDSAAEAIRRCLEGSGDQVVVAPQSATALEHVRRYAPALIVLDLATSPAPAKVPAAVAARHRARPAAPSSLDGWELLPLLRLSTTAPIITLGGRRGLSAEETGLDGIAALDLGADDHLARPFNPLELAARAHAVLRRRRSAAGAGAGTPGRPPRP